MLLKCLLGCSLAHGMSAQQLSGCCHLCVIITSGFTYLETLISRGDGSCISKAKVQLLRSLASQMLLHMNREEATAWTCAPHNLCQPDPEGSGVDQRPAEVGNRKVILTAW